MDDCHLINTTKLNFKFFLKKLKKKPAASIDNPGPFIFIWREISSVVKAVVWEKNSESKNRCSQLFQKP
jgi:hypothetical protein